MRVRKLPGISEKHSTLLYRALGERSSLSEKERSGYSLPRELSGNWAAQWWWALFTEINDRPLWTLLGLLAALSYPLFWGLHHFR
jgi:hypothetical protein